MLTFTGDQLQGILKDKYPQASSEIDGIDFLTFPDLEGSVKADVEYLKNHPLVLKESIITGWVYEVETGKVRKQLLEAKLIRNHCHLIGPPGCLKEERLFDPMLMYHYWLYDRNHLVRECSMRAS